MAAECHKLTDVLSVGAGLSCREMRGNLKDSEYLAHVTVLTQKDNFWFSVLNGTAVVTVHRFIPYLKCLIL
jgi:hypothetical protein